ncbi:MAG: hypothetical protein HYW34_01265 [Candidatus Brennerbacteria bacterium]|nr:hypothetical protein [Candidatus Brennerbacteria bacterium]
MKIWKKFYRLGFLKVSFETTFTEQSITGLDPRYREGGLIYNGPPQKVYEPALEVGLGSGEDALVDRVVFELVQYPAPNFRYLQFTRLNVNGWIVAARLTEDKVFGFDAPNSWDKNYLHLAYPGMSGVFEPVYFKVLAHKKQDLMVVWAEEESDRRIVVKGMVIDARMTSVPNHLILAKPASAALR